MANSISGVAGCVLNDSTVIVGIKEWSIDYSVDMFDITEFAASAPTHKTQLSGLKSATGSFSGNVTDGATGALGVFTIGTSYTLNLETDGTDKYSMTAYITGFSVSVAVGGEATVTANFTSSGDVSPTFS